MRYVGGDYDQFDDDDEEEVEDDDDERDDDEESSSSSSQSRVNPFGGSSSGSGNRPTSNLPGAGGRTSPPPSGTASSASRPPVGSTAGGTGNRPTTPGSSPFGSGSSSGSGSSGGSSPFGGSRPAGSSSPSTSGGNSGSTFGGGNRPATPGGSSFGGSGSSSGGSSQFGNRPAGSSPSSPGGSSGSSSPQNRPATSSGSSFGGSGSSSGGSSQFGGSRPAASSAPAGGSSPAKPASTATKPEEKKSGGMLGGITGRFGGSGDKKDKPATPKTGSAGGGALGGITSSLGGITGRFGGGAKAGDKPATPKASSGGGGLLGGITGRFGGGAKAADKKPTTTGSSSSSSSSPFGGTRSTGTNPAVGGSKPVTSSTGGSSPFGRLGGNTGPGAKPAASAGKGGAKTGFSRFLPSFLTGDSSAKPAPKARTSKAPTLDDGAGLSLDTKLDILGVALLLSSLALIFSRLSTTEGKLTQAINDFLIGIAGWGSIAIPVAMLMVGVWLIARHFGETAPVIPRKRIIGLMIGYLAVLTLMSYIDTFNFVGARAVHNFQELALQMQLSLQAQTGGGRIGWETYYFLVSNVTEAGAFFMIVLLLIISSMFTLDIGAAELAMIVISNARTFQDTRQRRAQQRQAAAAASLEQLTAQTAATAVSVAKEVAPALPAAPAVATLPLANDMAALPAGEPVRAERPIAINIGGKKELGGFGTAEMVPVERESVGVPPKPANGPTPSPAAGIAGRFGSMIPGRKAPEPASAAPATAKAESVADTTAKPSIATTAAAATAGAVAGGIGRLFNRGGNKDDSAKPADKPIPTSQPATTLSTPQPAAATINANASAAASAAPAPVRSPMPPPSSAPAAPVKQEPPPTRLGELMKPATSPASPAAPANGSGFGAPNNPARPAFSPTGSSGGTSSAPPARTFGGDAPKPFGTSSSPASTSTSAFAAKPPVPASPLKTSSAFKRPEDDMDDLDDDIDDEDEMDDSAELSNLPPAQPKGFGEPLPRAQTSRFGASTFGSSKPADASSPDRMGRLNEIRQGSTPAPASTKPNDNGQPANKPATPGSQPAAASAAPATPVGGSVTMSPFGKPSTAAPNGPSTSSAFGKPSTPPPAVSNKPAVPSAGDNKAPQPAAAFWKDTPAASVATPAKTFEPEKSEAPRPKVEPAAPSYGKPPDPAGVTINPGGRDGMASAALTSPPPPPPHTAAAAVPDATPIGRSAEIPLRQPGVGTAAPMNVPRKRKEWRMPSISQVLMPGSENDFDRGELLRRARTIEETLQSFGAPGKVVEVNTGPVITQFGVEPDYLVTRSGKKNRVKVGAIAQLDKDLQLALGAKSIRIEAPVPGKGYVGIEVPNDQASLVSLRDVMESDQFKKLFNKSPLAIALGQSVDGTPISADLGSMPHLLIAGTTGSGKSVCVNAIITSLIAMNPPDRVKFIMVDPKRVELTGYNGIPHLVAPVVVELERIVGVLKWVTREMDERYKKFSLAGARNIEDFNKHLQSEAEVMPYIIVIIDELADLMMMAPDETERVITRIAALARATGIHLVIATQRPSVDVVTGLIKANFPARIAFAVAGGVDSRVILDQPGAERLLGKGDMLYMSGDAPAALRLQGVYVSDQEIQNITRYWKSQITADDVAARPINALVVDNTVAEPSRSVVEGNERAQAQQAFWDTDMKQGSGNGSSTSREDDVSDDQEDVLYEEAVEMVRRLGKASVSLLQRRLRIGYTRSARLIDRMEEEGIVGPAVEGAKPREVLPLK